MGQEGEICRVVSPPYVKDTKTNLGISYDLGDENCWSLSSYDKDMTTQNYMGNHTDTELLQRGIQGVLCKTKEEENHQ